MEQNNETKQSDKLVFGLSPKATIINAIILSVLSQIFWVMSVSSQIHNNPELQSPITVPWYYDLPLSILSMLMVIKWIEYKYKIERNDMSFRALMYKFGFGICLTSLFQLFIKIVLLVIVLSFKLN